MSLLGLDDVVFAAIAVLEAHDVEYAVIGGLAVNAFGFARMTQNVDLCLALEHDERAKIQAVLDGLQVAGFRAHREAIDRRLDAGRSLITVYLQLTRVDLFLRRPGDTWGGVLAHRMPVALGSRTVLVASPEDIVAIKLLAARPHDLSDARGIVDIKRDVLDLPRLEATVAKLAKQVGRPELNDDLDALLRGPVRK